MSIYTRRRRRVRDWLEANDLDALVVTSPVNVRYLLGFAGEGIAVIGTRTVTLSSDRRFEPSVHEITGRVRVSLHQDGHLAGAAEALRSAGCRRVAFEADHLSVCGHERLLAALQGVEWRPSGPEDPSVRALRETCEALEARRSGDSEPEPVVAEADGIELTPCHNVVEELRMFKSADEVEAIRRAARIMDKALKSVLGKLAPGCTEREVAAELTYAASLAGADGMAFAPIVAFGPASACPHATPSDRKLKADQPVLIDCGAMVDGYCSDITRTVFVGEPDERYRSVYMAVLEAQTHAVRTAEVGFEARDVDRAARYVLQDHDLADYFSHGVGHGVGLQVHEFPTVNVRSRVWLEPGMVITVEPGVYIEGWGGVRIEDTVLITRGACEVLTRTPKQRW